MHSASKAGKACPPTRAKLAQIKLMSPKEERRIIQHVTNPKLGRKQKQPQNPNPFLQHRKPFADLLLQACGLELAGRWRDWGANPLTSSSTSRVRSLLQQQFIHGSSFRGQNRV